jgi:hypothetical protein
MRNGKKECSGVSKIGTSHLTHIPVFKRPSKQWRKEYASVRYPPLHYTKRPGL